MARFLLRYTPTNVQVDLEHFKFLKNSDLVIRGTCALTKIRQTKNEFLFIQLGLEHHTPFLIEGELQCRGPY